MVGVDKSTSASLMLYCGKGRGETIEQRDYPSHRDMNLVAIPTALPNAKLISHYQKHALSKEIII